MIYGLFKLIEFHQNRRIVAKSGGVPVELRSNDKRRPAIHKFAYSPIRRLHVQVVHQQPVAVHHVFGSGLGAEHFLHDILMALE